MTVVSIVISDSKSSCNLRANQLIRVGNERVPYVNDNMGLFRGIGDVNSRLGLTQLIS